MKAVLLVEDEGEAGRARSLLKSFGFESLRYRNAIKALDNLEEIEPDALVVSAEDFPRHWKVLAEVVRSSRGRNDCVIILLGGERFDVTEADKATRLKVNGVLGRLDSARERSRFERVLKRYLEVRDPRGAERVAPEPWDRIAFAFTHPESLKPVFGRVETFSQTGLSFVPALPFAEFSEGARLPDCSLKVGERLFDLSCRITRTGMVLGLSIESISDDGREYLVDYLARATEREIKARAAG